ncbi:MAG: response regulator transcription factor [Clostridiaceae bacterium]|nr:response regulator transcription factor [Clostridiaceae bacterium]
MTNILLLEDDESLNRGISFKLKKEGFQVFSAKTINEAKEIFSIEKVQLILADVGLPDGNGFDFCQEVRKKSDVLMIFLTACDQEVDIVTGFDLGADDYITKPFSLMILISRINALLRRNLNKNSNKKITSGNVTFYFQEMKVKKNELEIILSKTELKLLKFLMDNPQQILTRERLLNELWDLEGMFVDQNTVAVNIRRLREKIEDNPSEPEYIKTMRGIGYVWNRDVFVND